MAKIIVTRKKRLKQNGFVTVNVINDSIKIIHTFHNRQILRPPVYDTFINNAATCFNRLHLIRSTTKWSLNSGFCKIFSFPIMLRQDRHLTHDKRQFTVSSHIKCKFHTVWTFCYNRFHVRIVSAIERMPLSHKRVKTPNNIFRRYRNTIVPTRLLT